MEVSCQSVCAQGRQGRLRRKEAALAHVGSRAVGVHKGLACSCQQEGACAAACRRQKWYACAGLHRATAAACAVQLSGGHQRATFICTCREPSQHPCQGVHAKGMVDMRLQHVLQKGALLLGLHVQLHQLKGQRSVSRLVQRAIAS